MEIWSPQLLDFIKVNFDGVSKGKLGPLGTWGVIKDAWRLILRVFSMSLGTNINISNELEALEKRFCITIT
jgi:hypothetical protein